MLTGFLLPFGVLEPSLQDLQRFGLPFRDQGLEPLNRIPAVIGSRLGHDQRTRGLVAIPVGDFAGKRRRHRIVIRCAVGPGGAGLRQCRGLSGQGPGRQQYRAQHEQSQDQRDNRQDGDLEHAHRVEIEPLEHTGLEAGVPALSRGSNGIDLRVMTSPRASS